MLPVRPCMNANVILRFVLLYGVPPEALDRPPRTSRRPGHGALTELPGHRFRLDEIAAAQDAVERRAVGKVLVVPTKTPAPGGRIR